MPREVDLGLPQLALAVEIGRGAAGVVYKAEQPGINRTVAVKMLPFAALDEAARARFERECKAMGALSSHPGIVTVYDAGFTPSGQPYIIMELMDGGSLSDRLARDGRFGWEETCEFGIRLANALDAAHRKGVLHRDVKPDNVLISSYGDAKLSDFSIARVSGATQTQTGLVSATPAHAAPEILRGDPPTEQADVYSLGSTLVNLLLGSPAFVRDTDTTIFPVLTRVERDPVPDLRPLGVPDAVCRVLERSMAKDLAHRQHTAAEFAAELASARDSVRSGQAPVIGPAPPPASTLGATMVAGAPLLHPGSQPNATGGYVPSPPIPPGPYRQDGPAAGAPAAGGRGRTLAMAGGAVVVVVALVAAIVVVATRGSGGGSTSSTSATSSGQQSSAQSSGAGIDTAAVVVTAADLPGGFAENGSDITKLDGLTPCNAKIDVGNVTQETDRGFQKQAVNVVLIVGADVATFQSGGAASYLNDLSNAVGSCGGQYTDTSGGLTTNDTITSRDGPQIGDQTVRYTVHGQGDAVTLNADVVAFRVHDSLAVIIVTSTGSADAADAESVAKTQARRLGAP